MLDYTNRPGEVAKLLLKKRENGSIVLLGIRKCVAVRGVRMFYYFSFAATFLKDNIEWLFSGIGVSALALLFSIFHTKKLHGQLEGRIINNQINGSNNRINVSLISINSYPAFFVIEITIISILLGCILYVFVWEVWSNPTHSSANFLLAAISLLMTACSWGAFFCLYRKSRTRKLEVEGVYLSSVNNTNSNISLNRWISFQSICHKYTIVGQDLMAENLCDGIVASKRFNNSVCFSVFGETTGIDETSSYGFDIIADPEEEHKITPIPLNKKNISQVLQIPLLAVTEIHGRVTAKFVTKVPGCMRYGKDYVSAYAASSNKNPLNFTVNLNFVHDFPQYVRAYHIDYSKLIPSVKLDGVLRPIIKEGDVVSYKDATEIKSRHYQKIYIFER